MIPILDKKEFYKLLLKDRYPVAKIDFPTETGNGKIEFIHTPLGVLLHVYTGGAKLKEMKMYDRNYGDIEINNVFCGENLVCIDGESCVCISGKLKIEDVIGRSFLIKFDGMSVVARAEFVPRGKSNIDKLATMVYN